MSLFPVVSQLDAVDANYLTAVTQEGFLVHYHDLQRLDGPAPYDLEGGKHAKTSVWNQILHSPDRSSGFRSTTQRLIPDPFGKMKSTFSRKKIDQTPKVGSRSASGVFCDHWRNTRGGSTSRAMGPGYYDPPTRDRFGKLIGGDVGQEFVENKRRRRRLVSPKLASESQPRHRRVRGAHRTQVAFRATTRRGFKPR
mmetsp:Transcript_13044/g.43233  ORF Transcript_13044/g.43233 Transcript_13044/m.43233 type:complete len:196 (+) Transcript_13044:199-786(+)